MGNNVLWLSNHFHVNSSLFPLFCFYNCNHTINLIRKPFEWWPSGEVHSLRSQLCLSTHCRQKSQFGIVDETWNKIQMMPSLVKFTVQILKLLISRVLVNSFFFCHALDCTKISLKGCQFQIQVQCVLKKKSMNSSLPHTLFLLAKFPIQL